MIQTKCFNRCLRTWIGITKDCDNDLQSSQSLGYRGLKAFLELKMYRTFILVLLAITLFMPGCAGLVGHRYAGSEMSHDRMPHRGRVMHADYTVDEGCTSCGSGGHLGGIGSGAGHSCDGSVGCTPHCDRCEGGKSMPIGSMRGMPLLERLKSRFACGDGCGEVYIGEWISTPPTPDPCDQCGNFTGQCNHMMFRPDRQPVRNTLRGIAGLRFAGGCNSCGTAECDGGCGNGYVESEAAQPIMQSYVPMARPMTTAKPDCGCGH